MPCRRKYAGNQNWHPGKGIVRFLCKHFGIICICIFAIRYNHSVQVALDWTGLTVFN